MAWAPFPQALPCPLVIHFDGRCWLPSRSVITRTGFGYGLKGRAPAVQPGNEVLRLGQDAVPGRLSPPTLQGSMPEPERCLPDG